MLATASDPPADPTGWSVEFKWDGWRACAGVTDDTLRIWSRNGTPLLPRFPELDVLREIAAGRDMVLDGEIVALDRNGKPSFSLLQQRTGPPTAFARKAAPARLFVFDLLQLDGRSLLALPYRQRRDMLTDLALPGDHPIQVPPAWHDQDPAVLLKVAAAHELEGIVLKRTGSPYLPGKRSRLWIKMPLLSAHEAIICGWTPGTGARAATLGSLLLGAHTGTGLTYIGRVGSGIGDDQLLMLRRRLDALRQERCPFDHVVPREDARAAQWVAPVLVGEVQFRGWTSTSGGRRLRQPVWRGLRLDRDADDVRLYPALDSPSN